MPVLIKQIEVGPMANFVYFIGDTVTREVALVDPAWQIDTLLGIAKKEDLKITAALVTHSHFDHCNGIEELLSHHDIPVYAQKKEAEFVRGMGDNKSDLFSAFPSENLKTVQHGDELQIGQTRITFLHTPGHTPGSQCFLVGQNLVAGDTLFVRGCGRCDLPGGNAQDLYESLSKKLLTLPDDTILFPGHNYSDEEQSTIRKEKSKNPYFLCTSLNAFLSLTARG